MKQSKLNAAELYQVILSPIVTEKSTRMYDKDHQYAFYVLPSATRNDIKAAIELAFEDQKVKVESVRTATVKGKQKRFGTVKGRRVMRKKAYVRLAEGSDIDFAQFQA